MGKRRPSTAIPGENRLRRVDQRPERFRKQIDRSLQNLIVIGASAGGIQAIKQVLRGLSVDIPAAVIIMLHMSRTQEFKLENALRESTRIPMVPVQTSARLTPGTIYVARPGQSVFLQGRTLQIEPQKEAHPTITINRLFESAAQQYQDRVIGIILSGLLSDGTAGLRAVHKAGGLTIVQDPAEAEYSEMPTNAMRDLPITFCLKATEIGSAADLLVRRKGELETGLAASARMLKERVALFTNLLAQSVNNPTTHRFLSREMRALHNDVRSVEALLHRAMTLTGKAKLHRRVADPRTA